MNNFLQMVSNDLFCLCKKNINLNPKYVQFYKKIYWFNLWSEMMVAPLALQVLINGN